MDKEIDRIFTLVDGLLSNGEWKQIDKLLGEVDTDNITILVAWLAITNVEWERFPARTNLIDKVRKLEPDRADRLLKGLE